MTGGDREDDHAVRAGARDVMAGFLHMLAYLPLVPVEPRAPDWSA